MATLISDNGASIKLTIGTQVRNIFKSQIVEIAVIKTNIIKIDIGMGSLYNIYIPYADVTSPVTASPEALRDAISALLPNSSNSGGTSGGATEAKQIQEIDILNIMKNDLNSMKGTLTGMDGKVLPEPLIVDESGVGLIYKGYANIGTPVTDVTWAIQRIERRGEVNTTTWANGNKNFTNRWEEREILVYS